MSFALVRWYGEDMESDTDIDRAIGSALGERLSSDYWEGTRTWH